MSDHEHDEDGNCIIPEGEESPFYPGGLPTWRFSGWDVIGIAATGIGGLFSVTGQALNLLARECSAMANWNRQNYDLEQAQREHDEYQAAGAAELRALLGDDISADES